MAGQNGSSLELSFLYYQSITETIDFMTTIKSSLVLSTALFFISLNLIMFVAMWSKSSFRETSRYLLFSQMLLSDSIHLGFTTLLYSCSMANINLIKVLCSMIVLVSGTTFRISPLTLAVMCLERYVAICFPLRHTDIATPGRTNIAIAVVWFLGSVNYVINIIFLAATDTYFLTKTIYCTQERLFLAKWQFDVFQSFNGVFFVAVGITVIGTYTGIMMAAQSIKAKKASRTVLLHLVQLVLCLSSFLFSSIERALSTISSALFIHLRTLNFFLLVLLPRCLSPLIYGLRDEGVRPLFLRYLRCGRWRIKPRTSTR
ncbi:odorant receptor 131-2-like isoform X1 [Brienomyrus brachyistius]|uniref:odorant receptor 131-2-like isoform X1 n=1 Tax=Brienomyrus brachyistius TaxID=42636 RepID=UPI0020B29764|nr:odorant receptor 131-2-like isoform X1 [Brienomyrus brachyistius]XP_048852855.1 odorant receptor 131-2-like isoform X1 [Brienomyrus brachyistius]XP_048852856.1 odorant receptor 131-2-like isoform X1 [Brienomyrus brachyistius]XP_048852857.1 odorant receptor 131-2-like isoform X1 [Brienomyrus brachyistius]XP_048852893.1 odorant receptor 131-2-like isoform X1 [Brienomyrus brachyistius]XP_048852894.1 odorant receptor 131-2-like isoform X1 [Brienomyrus brachyistius]XP_048852895.1 odorant recept